MIQSNLTDEIGQFDYHYIVMDEDGARAAGIVDALAQAGVNLLALSEFPLGDGKSQLDLVAESADALAGAARKLGLRLSEKKTGFLIRGQNRPSAITQILKRLADAQIAVTALQTISAGAGRFGAMLWVKPQDVETAAMVLDCSRYDGVDEASEESFPASDSPAWPIRR